MNKIKIITDSCSDLTVELLEKYDIDYAKMNTVLEGKTSEARLSWTALDVKNFYDIMRNGTRITTTQVPVEEFQRVFTKYLDQNMDIIYIACSSKQSGSVNTAAVLAKNELAAKYPNNKIYCIDSLNASMGEGLLAIEAAKMAAEGKAIEEINEKILAIRKNVNEYATVHTLEWLRKAGRVKATAAFFGNLMGVKPILIADREGNQVGFKKVKGRQTSFNEIVKLMKEALEDPANQTVYLLHGDCPEEEVEQLKELVQKEISPKEIYVSFIGPIIGASCGPNVIGLWAWGKEVTYTTGE
jgi:DegV family protein with EDD domain